MLINSEIKLFDCSIVRLFNCSIIQSKIIFVSALLLFQIILCFSVSYSQDIHYTQFTSSPLNLNAGLTGNFNNDYRLVMNGRQQWRSIPVPYETFSASFDTKVLRTLVPRSWFGAGILLNADRAGDSEFGTTQVKLLASYHRVMNTDSTFVLSAGLNAAFNQNNINYNNLYWDYQFVGGQYVSNAPTGEDFSQMDNKLTYFDCAVGLNMYYLINDKVPLNTGISFLHLNKPKRSFFDNEDIDLNNNFLIYSQSQFFFNEQWSAIPSIMYMRQGKFHEFDAGGFFKYDIDNVSFRAFYFGAWMRLKDAGNLAIALDYQNIYIGISYDINTSKLTEASNGRGGLEVAIIYMFGRSKYNTIPYKVKCPRFI